MLTYLESTSSYRGYMSYRIYEKIINLLYIRSFFIKHPLEFLEIFHFSFYYAIFSYRLHEIVMLLSDDFFTFSDVRYISQEDNTCFWIVFWPDESEYERESFPIFPFSEDFYLDIFIARVVYLFDILFHKYSWKSLVDDFTFLVSEDEFCSPIPGCNLFFLHEDNPLEWMSDGRKEEVLRFFLGYIVRHIRDDTDSATIRKWGSEYLHMEEFSIFFLHFALVRWGESFFSFFFIFFSDLDTRSIIPKIMSLHPEHFLFGIPRHFEKTCIHIECTLIGIPYPDSFTHSFEEYRECRCMEDRCIHAVVLYMSVTQSAFWSIWSFSRKTPFT